MNEQQTLVALYDKLIDAHKKVDDLIREFGQPYWHLEDAIVEAKVITVQLMEKSEK